MRYILYEDILLLMQYAYTYIMLHEVHKLL